MHGWSLRFFRMFVILSLLASFRAAAAETKPLRIATFTVDATPPIGSPLCLGGVEPVRIVVDPLSIRGIVLMSAEKPIVLCAVDWVGIANDAHDRFRDALALGAGTTRDRVAVHCLHQHDAPGCDFESERLLANQGLGGKLFDVEFAEDVIQRAGEACGASLADAQEVTHIGTGEGKVEEVASNRRILGPDGKVIHVRYTACADPKVRAFPEGTIDPVVKLVSFWQGEKPLVVLSYYATHPQSYYNTGGVTADFVGMARAELAASLPGTFCVHFNGAGGNIGAGKFNDGAPTNRPILAGRLAAGMKAAWQATTKSNIAASDVDWRVVPVTLPITPRFKPQELRGTLEDITVKFGERREAARGLAFLQRGGRIELSRLKIGSVCLIHMPGELFVEYQLEAQQIEPDSFICMAAYGDYGPGYIGTQVAYYEGGYETGSPSRVAPDVERVLRKGLEELLR